MRKLWLFFLMLICLPPAIWATQIPGTIILLNDSPFILTATVYAHSGDFLGQATLQPGEQKNFTSNLSSTSLSRPGISDVSITPYRIIWTCSGGGMYSTNQNGSSSSLIRATDGTGQQTCTPKEAPPPADKTGAKKSK